MPAAPLGGPFGTGTGGGGGAGGPPAPGGFSRSIAWFPISRTSTSLSLPIAVCGGP